MLAPMMASARGKAVPHVYTPNAPSSHMAALDGTVTAHVPGIPEQHTRLLAYPPLECCIPVPGPPPLGGVPTTEFDALRRAFDVGLPLGRFAALHAAPGSNAARRFSALVTASMADCNRSRPSTAPT